jgi:hypothetical protein
MWWASRPSLGQKKPAAPACKTADDWRKRLGVHSDPKLKQKKLLASFFLKKGIF